MANNGNVAAPNVLVLGGVGFIGRNVVHYLVKNSLANKIVVVDKVIPQMGWLCPEHKESLDKVQFKHANLINPKSVANVFHLDDGEKFDFVINCAAESKLGQSEAVYREGIYRLSCNCAREAARQGVQRYIEMSTAQISSHDKKAASEEAHSSDPRTMQSRQKQEVEQELSDITGLNYIIVRPALVYGRGDRTGLTSRLVLAGVYKQLHEPMQMLWSKDFKMNTVHVEDVARATWHLCCHGTNGEVYNLADKGDTTQGKIGDIINELFDIRSEYLGTFASTFAKYNISEILEEVNEKHMVPWSEACTRDFICNTPLTPYIDKEVLLGKQLPVDGSKIESTGFQYLHPSLTQDSLKQVLDEYVAMGLYPSSLVGKSLGAESSSRHS